MVSFVVLGLSYIFVPVGLIFIMPWVFCCILVGDAGHESTKIAVFTFQASGDSMDQSPKLM